WLLTNWSRVRVADGPPFFYFVKWFTHDSLFEGLVFYM
ncbi:MAG: hypothetical protein ACI9LH_001349, partial [Porticoccaceae bacterium]